MKKPLLSYKEYMLRYNTIVDNMEQLLNISTKPLPKIIWINTLKTCSQDVQKWLSKKEIDFQPVNWLKGAWKIPADIKPGRWPEFMMGLVHCCEEISILPAFLLDAKPDEHILDICAAPGNKTVKIAMMMNGQGHLIANDINFQRTALLQDMVNRLGITNISVTYEDAQKINSTEKFDRILIDVPCSAEGNIRKSKWRRRTEDNSKKLNVIQFKILLNAIELLKPGGVAIYSTCTYAPEENEWVLNHLDPKTTIIEKIHLPKNLKADSGIVEWHNQKFRPDVKNGLRFWPHYNDTGGFFVAKIRKF